MPKLYLKREGFARREVDAVAFIFKQGQSSCEYVSAHVPPRAGSISDVASLKVRDIDQWELLIASGGVVIAGVASQRTLTGVELKAHWERQREAEIDGL